MKIKKIQSSVLFCLCIICISMIGCGNANDTKIISKSEIEQSEQKKVKCDIALVTDLGTIGDRSFNQASWVGIEKYAKENNLKCKFYQPEEGTTYAYVDTIDIAVADGAKLVVCPGYLYETPVFVVQDKYPNVCFILIDGEPHNSAYTETKINKNVLAILFEEEQAGFLAGYAAVKDGNTKLGFMGGMAVPAVIQYGYGFVQGADLAAKELGIKIEITYTYTGSFTESYETQIMAASWYKNGTDVIFACGGALGNSVMVAAEASNAKVIGVDTDQSQESETVITSAIKMITDAVYVSVKDYFDGTFKGGVKEVFSAETAGVGLPMQNSKFKSFTKKDYDKIYKKLVSGKIKIFSRTDNSTTKDIPLKFTKVNFIQ
ncbi:BMP family lipoprotein [Anaerosacchariphilus polymeriproducens]|uniref:BMP family ABC transporter substrate-binding protein n=1 Tax=Anaerosacchariphilus polymeriproducens TaxID=1812858 RepID=A0A371AXW0_9FIRM|nr:BMP family ABC transporter substrate-binding protein [Anaerosacchariphilus polymeriproducens]RDU24389.1 BMP family ABC transporter substrate-binding protein [Anaerosacchariphilus polymeriproducens]